MALLEIRKGICDRKIVIIGQFVGGGSCVNAINTSVKVQCRHCSVITAKYPDRSSVMEAFTSFFVKSQHGESDGWMDG